MLVLQPIDAVASHAEALAGHRPAVLAALLPALSAAVASPRQSPDARFCCLKLLCDVVLAYLAEPPRPSPGAAPVPGSDGEDGGDGELGTAAALVDEAVARHVLPLMPALLQDEGGWGWGEPRPAVWQGLGRAMASVFLPCQLLTPPPQNTDPMPLYALKMLGILLEANPGWAADLARLGLARR